jgi:hypothetical protein
MPSCIDTYASEWVYNWRGEIGSSGYWSGDKGISQQPLSRYRNSRRIRIEFSFPWLSGLGLAAWFAVIQCWGNCCISIKLPFILTLQLWFFNLLVLKGHSDRNYQVFCSQISYPETLYTGKKHQFWYTYFLKSRCSDYTREFNFSNVVSEFMSSSRAKLSRVVLAEPYNALYACL